MLRVISVIFFGICTQSAAESEIKKDLRENVVLTPDFGLISEHQLHYAVDDAPQKMWFSDPRTALTLYPWVCAPTSNIKIYCTDKNDDPEGWHAHLRFDTPSERFIYFYPKIWGKEFCLDQIVRMRRLLRNQSHACVAGVHAESNLTSPTKTSYWEFRRFLTKKGSLCWFDSPKWNCSTE